jgi:intein/homing endonuclease
VPLDKNTRPPIEQIKSEWTKCANSPIYFLSEYGYIRTEEKGIVNFEPFDYQKEILDYLRNDSVKHIGVVKSRQLGLSTIVAGFAAWSLIFRKDRHIFNMAIKLETAQIILEMVRTFIEECPKWLNFWTFKKNNTRIIALSNGSWIRALPTTIKMARGEAASLFIIDEAGLVDKLDEAYTAIAPSVACVSGDTRIVTNKGVKRIEELCIGQQANKFFGIDGVNICGSKSLEKISHGFISPESEIIKFGTKHGFEIETTSNHPLLTMTCDGPRMKSASELKIGDYLRIDIGRNVWGNNDYIGHPDLPHITNDFAYMLGGYAAEGNMSGRRSKDYDAYAVVITNTDNDFRNVYLTNKVIRRFRTEKRYDRIFCSSVEMVKLFNWFGYYRKHHSHLKFIPEKIFECSPKIVGSFLSGLFDGDGSVSNQDINMDSSSLKLLQQTQQLLLNFGILSSVTKLEDPENRVLRARLKNHVMPTNNKSIQSAKQMWRLIIQQSYFTLFQKFMNFKIKYKRNTLNENVLRIKSKKFVDFVAETMPMKYIKNKFINIVLESGASWSYFRKMGFRYDAVMYGEHISYEMVVKLKDVLVNDKLPISLENEIFLNDLLEHRCIWVPIRNTKKLVDKIAYDLTVPDNHTFLQNGIVGGNTGGRIIVLSTPFGSSGKFAEIIQNGSRIVDGKLIPGTNEFLVFEYPWMKRYDQAWFDKMKIGKSPRELAMEFECKFLESGNTFIDASILQRIRSEIEEPREYRYDDKMWIWGYPLPGKQYIIGSDCARGDSSDSSTFQIIDIETLEVVAEYRHKIKTDEFARVLCDVGRLYNNAMVIPERNAYGSAVIQDMLKLEYENVYFVFNGMYISRWDLPSFPKAQAGHTTSSATRPVMMQRLEEFIRLGKIKIHSKRLYDEFTTFSWKGDKPCAPRNKSDDLVLALAIGIYIYEQVYGDGTNLQKFRNTNSGEPVGFFRTGETLAQAMQPRHEINVQGELERFMMAMGIRRG